MGGPHHDIKAKGIGSMTKAANSTTPKKTGPRKQAPKLPASDVATIADTGDHAQAKSIYEEHIPGWADLPKQQRTAIIEMTAAFREKPKPLEMKLSRTEAGGYNVDRAEGNSATYHALKLGDTFATTSLYFPNDKLNELVNHFRSHNNRGATELDLNSALAFINGARPQNEVEATLAVQMVATNAAAMKALAMVGKAEWVDNVQMYGNLAIKLLRTFAMQAEALAKLQRGGEQTVKHVHVDNRGGQAIVTDTVVTGGQNGKDAEQSYAARDISTSAALPGPDPLGNGVPVPSCEGEAAMQDAWGHEPRRAEG
jgi:hypothetical protein